MSPRVFLGGSGPAGADGAQGKPGPPGADGAGGGGGLDDLLAPGGRSRRHGALAELLKDDHTQYALLAGRAGGQTLIGGTASGEDLILQSTSHATRGTVQVRDTMEAWAAARTLTTTDNAVTQSDDITLGANGGYRYLLISSVIPVTATTVGTNLGQVFNFAPTYQLNSGLASGNMSGKTIQVFKSAPAITCVGTGTSRVTGLTLRQFLADPNFGTANTPTNPHTVTLVAGLDMAGTVNDADWNPITDWAAVYMRNPAGSAGTISRVVGLHMDAITHAGAAAAHSVRSLGTTTKMRHVGPIVVGADADPTNASVGLEIQSTTLALLLSRLTTAQRDALTGVDGLILYNETMEAVGAYINGAWDSLAVYNDEHNVLPVVQNPATQTNWSTLTIDSLQILNGYLASSGAQNDEIGFDIALRAGTYSFTVIGVDGANSGIIQLKLDGTNIGTIDQYAAATARNTVDTISGVAVATAGRHRLLLKMETKNAASGNYVGSVSSIKVRRTG